MTPFARYKRDFSNIHVFFTPQAQAAWDFFLSAQNSMNITGDFVEIGVLRGKSAILGALYLRPDETAVLVDINDPVDTEQMIKGLEGPKIAKFVGKSCDFTRSQTFKDITQVRWFHIDGDHSGFSTSTDLEIAAQMIVPKGLLCVDDFLSP